MSENIANLDIIMEIPNFDISITDLNMDFWVEKDYTNAPDTAYIKIWNMNEEYYKLIKDESQLINLYTQYVGFEKELLFSGYTKPVELVHNSLKYGMHPVMPPTQDTVTAIRLVESRTVYNSSFINKNYRQLVSSSQIIYDCIEAMGLGNVIITSEIPEKIYSSYKAIGRPHVILSDMCRMLNLPMVIQNGIIYIGSLNKDCPDNNIFELNITNSNNPQLIGQNIALFISKYNTYLAPNMLVKCNFSDLNGVFKVLKISSIGNNYDTVCTTEIIVGI